MPLPTHRRKQIVSIILALFSLLSIAGFFRYVEWLDQDFRPGSPCRSTILDQLRHGMSQKEVLRLIPWDKGYSLKRRPYHDGEGVEEWSLRHTDFSESILIFFNIHGRVIRKGCGNA